MKQEKQNEQQEKDTPTLEQVSLEKQVAQDKARREEAFGKAIEAASKEFRCGLVPVVTVVGNNIESRVQIVAQ